MENFITIYLSHHTNIANVIFYIDSVSDKENVMNIIKETSLEKVIVCSNVLTKEDLSSFSAFNFVTVSTSFNDIKNIENYYIVFLNASNFDVCKQLEKLNCEILISLDNCCTDVLKIFEQFREITSHLVVAYPKDNEQNFYNVFDWKNDSDIELSVILPVYNVENYLDQCIKTITAWKAPYVEFLFVNDGSTDNSAQKIKEYSKKDNRIKLINKENGGCASARKLGLEVAKGHYVGFIDPDDFIDESMFKKLFEKAITGSYDISFCGYNEYYNNTGRIKPVDDILDVPYSEGVVDRTNIDFLIPFQRIGIWRAIYKKSFLKNNNITFDSSLRRFDDLPFKVLVYLKAESVISVPEHLYFYRLAREGQDVSANDERLFVHFDIFKKLDNSFASGVTDEQLDYYHIVKIHTHLWALSKLKKEFIKEYKKLAKKDLLTLYNKDKIYNAVERYCSKKILRKTRRILF